MAAVLSCTSPVSWLRLFRASPWYTVEEVAELTQMSPMWIWRQCREERIPHHRFGKGQGVRYRFSDEDLRRLAAEPRLEASTADELVPASGAKAMPPTRGDRPVASLGIRYLLE